MTTIGQRPHTLEESQAVIHDWMYGPSMDTTPDELLGHLVVVLGALEETVPFAAYRAVLAHCRRHIEFKVRVFDQRCADGRFDHHDCDHHAW